MDKQKANVYINQGATFFSDGNIASAIKCFRTALKFDPNSIEAHFNLGLCFQKEPNEAKAMKHFERVLVLEPHDFEALNNLGNLYLGKREIKKAIIAYKKAVAVNPRLTEGFYNLGVCFQELNQNKEAIGYYKKSLKLNPNNEKVLNNLAVAYKRVGMVKDAIESFKKALKVNPKLPMALSNLGALIIFQDPKEALKYLSRAVKIEPGSVEALYNIGVAYQTLGDVVKATEVFKKVVRVSPSFGQVYGQLYQKLRAVVDWDEAEKVFTRMEKLSQKALAEGRIPPETPFISVSTFQDPKRNLKVARAWSKFDNDNVSGFLFKPKYAKKRDSSRINIGYLSYDFHDHATMHLLSGVLRLHHKKRFSVYAYSFGPESNSRYRQLAQKYCRFRDIREISDLEAAKLIQKDKIDILVDLKGHTSGCRLGILALKPAPVAISWLGFPGTTGADYLDYLIADPVVVPRSETKFYSEKLIYLPDTYQPTDNLQEISQRKFTRSDFGLPTDPDVVVFSSFNQPFKIDAKVFAVWMKILKRVPQSVLWLWEGSIKAINNFRKEARKRGVARTRLVFSGSLPKPEHLARLKLADIALDTFTYNGHTTTSDCLWVGVPVVTLKGKHFASRVSASLLNAVNLPELITHSPKQYEKLAVSLAKNPKKLQSLRESLILNRKSYPLFDTQKFTANLEKAYEKVWKNYQRGQKPKSLK